MFSPFGAEDGQDIVHFFYRSIIRVLQILKLLLQTVEFDFVVADGEAAVVHSLGLLCLVLVQSRLLSLQLVDVGLQFFRLYLLFSQLVLFFLSFLYAVQNLFGQLLVEGEGKCLD